MSKSLDERLAEVARMLDAKNEWDEHWDTVREAADRIAKLEAALVEIEYLDRPQVRGLPRRKTIQQIALDALGRGE